MTQSKKNKVIFIFTTIGWEWSHTITQKIALELSKSSYVIYINPRKEFREIASTMFSVKEHKIGLKKINKNLIIIQPPICFPKFYRYNIFDNIIDRFYHHYIKLMANILFRKTRRYLMVLEPHFAAFIRYYSYEKLIYYPYDCFEKYTYDINDDDKIENTKIKDELKIIEKADCFYTVSKELGDYYYKKYKRRPKIIPNATSNKYFLDESKKTYRDKAEYLLENINGIKVGYSGGIKGVLDIEYIIKAARKLKNYSFIFMGKIIYTNIPEYDKKLKILFELDNVHYLGTKPVELLPYIMHKMDVLVMIYSSSNEVWTYYGDPAKLFEYMATGKYIISTPHPVINKYHQYVRIVQNEEDFITALKDVNNIRNEEGMKKRIELARQNTWEDRINQIKSDLN